jgi:glutathione-independent formaldehyde dehydrogenase
MSSNRGVVYMGPGKVEIHSIDFPKLALGDRKCEHGAI